MAEMTVHYTPPSGPNGERAQAPMVTPLEELRVNMYHRAWADLTERGWRPASVINLHPWTLYGNGVLSPIRELRIPGVPRDPEAWKKAPKLKLKSGAEVPYVKHVFAYPDITILEQVIGPEGGAVGNTSPQITLPIRFAEDIYQQNNNPVQRGGVFGYAGDHEPLVHLDSSDPKKEGERREIELNRLESAHAQQILHYNQLLEQANAAHAEKNSHKIREIQQYHRWAARYLRNLGVLAEDPEWLTNQVRVGPAVTQHCVCGAEVKSVAVICKECNHVLLPFEAFDQQVIDLETPGAKLVLKRMNTNQIAKLIELGRFTLDELDELGFVAKNGKKEKAEKAKEAVAKG